MSQFYFWQVPIFIEFENISKSSSNLSIHSGLIICPCIRQTGTQGRTFSQISRSVLCRCCQTIEKQVVFPDQTDQVLHPTGTNIKSLRLFEWGQDASAAYITADVSCNIQLHNLVYSQFLYREIHQQFIYQINQQARAHLLDHNWSSMDVKSLSIFG